MTTKICTVCNIEKDKSMFNNKKDSPDGKATRCKECKSINDKKYYAEKGDFVRSQVKAYRLSNPDKIKTRKRKYRSDNSDAIKEKERIYRLENKDKVNSIQREYRFANPDKFKMYRDARYAKIKSDPVLYFRFNFRNSIKSRLRTYNVTKYNPSDVMLGCSFSFLSDYISSMFLSGMSWENRTEWHIDHTIPLASALTNSEFIRLNHWSNLRPMWAKDNLSKGAAMPPLDVIDEVNMIYECCKLN